MCVLPVDNVSGGTSAKKNLSFAGLGQPKYISMLM